MSSEVCIVLFNLMLLHRMELKGPKTETLLFKATHDSPHQSPLYAIRLNHNISSLSHSTNINIITRMHFLTYLYSQNSIYPLISSKNHQTIQRHAKYPTSHFLLPQSPVVLKTPLVGPLKKRMAFALFHRSELMRVSII